MARKARKIREESSDDDAPEVVSHFTSKADAKRHQKALHHFEEEEKARKKARNRERDQKLKERARVTKRGRADDKSKEVRFVDQRLGEGQQGGEEDEDDDGDGDVEARMLRAMRDAKNEAENGEEDEDGGGDFVDFDQEMEVGDEMGSGSDISYADEDDEDAKTENDEMVPEAPTDDEEMGEYGDTSFRLNTQRSNRKPDYLADDLFAIAFTSQNSKLSPKKTKESAQQQTTKKRRRKAITRAKDLVVGGRIIRTLPHLSDPRSQATARSVPSARVRQFLDQNLAMKSNRSAIRKAKKKGWERRPANVGVMKSQGAPLVFVRSAR